MLTGLIELVNGIVDFLVGVAVIHLAREAAERGIYLLLKIGNEDILVLKTYVRVTFAGMLECLCLLSVLVSISF